MAMRMRCRQRRGTSIVDNCCNKRGTHPEESNRCNTGLAMLPQTEAGNEETAKFQTSTFLGL